MIKHRTTLTQLQIHSEQPNSIHFIYILLPFFFYSFHSFFWLLRECVLSYEILDPLIWFDLYVEASGW